MPINSGYSFYQYEGDGVTTQYPLQFSLGELKRAYVTCRVDNEVDAFGDPVYRAITDVPGDPGMVEIQGAVPADGVPIVFRRIVPKELLLHLYANGSILDYPSLDESHLQLMMALHEVLDGYGLTNVFTDINMNGYKLLNVFSDPDDPSSLATVEFLGTYRQDALNAAIAAADSALEAFGYRDTALAHAQDAAAQVVLCQDQVVLATAQAVLSSDYADDSSASALEAAGYAATLSGAIDDIGVLDTRLDAAELDITTLETNKLDKDQNIILSASVPASGTAVDFTEIPPDVKRVTVVFDGVSTNGSTFPIIRVADGTLRVSNYKGNSSTITDTGNGNINLTTGFTIRSAGQSSNVLHGKMIIEMHNTLCIATGSFGLADAAYTTTTDGSITMSGALSSIRVTTTNGTDQFDAGNISISWEF